MGREKSSSTQGGGVSRFTTSKELSMKSNEEQLDFLISLIQDAVESEQDEPADFKYETHLRLNYVFSELREILGIPPVNL